MNYGVTTSGLFVMKYPLLYLMIGLYLLYTGSENNYCLLSPDGEEATFLYLENNSVVLGSHRGSNEFVQSNALNLPQGSDLRITELRSGVEFDEGNAFRFGTYIIRGDAGSFLLEVRHYDDRVIYRISERDGNALFRKVSENDGDYPAWVTLPHVLPAGNNLKVP